MNDKELHESLDRLIASQERMAAALDLLTRIVSERYPTPVQICYHEYSGTGMTCIKCGKSQPYIVPTTIC